MSHRSSTTARLAATILAVSAAAPSFAAGQDLRSPDTRDAARRAVASAPRDLRSADARDAARRAAPSAPRDLRSPDARDAAMPQAITPLRMVTVAPDGFNWTDAGIGAAGVCGLVLLAAGGATTLARRRTQRRTVI